MKINIIRQNALKYRRIRLIRRIKTVIIFGSSGLFAAVVIYMTSQFVYLSFRQRNLTRSVTALTQTYNARSREIAEYIVVKDIVATVDDLAKKRFRYKEFLNGILAILPSRAVLVSVDFSASGVVVAGARLADLDDYDVLTGNIRRAGNESDFLFSGVAERLLSRDRSGSYSVTLEMKIK